MKSDSPADPWGRAGFHSDLSRRNVSGFSLMVEIKAGNEAHPWLHNRPAGPGPCLTCLGWLRCCGPGHCRMLRSRTPGLCSAVGDDGI